MAKQPSWQKRQVDSFGKFRIEYGTPTTNLSGERVYTLMAEGTAGNSQLGMRSDGHYDIRVDQTISIVGAAKGSSPAKGNGVEINSIAGGIAITATKGKITLSAENIDIIASNNLNLKAIKGKITSEAPEHYFDVTDLKVSEKFKGNNVPNDVVVRDAGFLAKCCKGTDVNYQQ
tara:strand:- start:3300 stop:3821 length:522 start_codon:yes stop_codon:yes gene_type:complete